MADIPKIVLPHGDRTVDQMIQAARSCKQNIAEGSSASGASKEKICGVRERMHAARTAARSDDFNRGLYSHLSEAKTPDELKSRAENLRREISRIVWGIERKRGWQ